MSRTHYGYAAAYVWYACIAYCVELQVRQGNNKLPEDDLIGDRNMSECFNCFKCF